MFFRGRSKFFVRLMALLTVSIVLLALSVPFFTRAQQPENDVAAALEVIAAVNEWRISQGVAPLRVNPVLTQMAIDQVQYLLSLPDMPDGEQLHTRPDGSAPRQYALNPQYNWPYYNTTEQVAVGENAAVGPLSYAMEFWNESQIHHDAALNPAYREVGAAAFPYGSGYLYMMDFGARPNVLPAQVDPVTGQIHLTSESYRFSSGDGRIQQVTTIHLFDSEGRPLTIDPVPFETVIDVPEGITDTLYVLYSDGKDNVLTRVNLQTDRILLPGHIYNPLVVPEAPAAVAVEPTAQSGGGSIFLATNTPEGGASTGSSAATPTIAVPTAVPPTAVPPPTAELLIVYDSRSLVVANVSGRSLDISAMELTTGDRTLRFNAWAQFSSVPLTAFTTGSCVQAYSWEVSNPPAAPAACRQITSVVTLDPNRLFWTTTDFNVVQNSNVLATCTANAGQCLVDIP